MAGSRTLPFRHAKRKRTPWLPPLLAFASSVPKRNETLRRLIEMPLTVFGVVCFSVAAFIGNEIAGFAVTGVCLIVLELMISDPDDVPSRNEGFE